MLSENRWKVILLVAASAVAAEPSRALSLVYQSPRSVPMFVPKSYYRRRSRQSRVLFLDEDENRQPFGRGEIDLTETTYNSKIKFDNAPDYEFTSPDDGETTSKTQDDEPSGNDRFYEQLPRFRAPLYPKYYQGRFGRPYAPSFGFDPYQVPVPYAPAVRNGYGWKARSPRVVFPYAEANSVQTNSHAGPGFDNSVVFRDQNFGLNDLGAEEQLQDIGTGSADAFAERDANDSHRAQINERTPLKRMLPPQLLKPMFIQTETKLPYIKRYDTYPNTTVLPEFKPISDAQMVRISEILRELTSTNKVNYSTKTRKGKLLEQDNVVEASNMEAITEKVIKEDRQDEKDCAQGGTCEFFFYCWMVGGLLEGSCGGLLKGCCHRVAKAGILGVHDSNSIEYSSNELSYGPVINDDSK